MFELRNMSFRPLAGEWRTAVFECLVTAISRHRFATLEIITCKHTTINENVL